MNERRNMRFKRFLDVARTPVQAYFKDGVELMYPDQRRAMRIAILPAYDMKSPDPAGWVPAICGNDETDFYTVIRAAKFVGHGNRRAKTSFLSPRTFDIEADDPYEAFYDYCSHSDKWSYLTKDSRGRRLTGEVEGAVFPRMKNFFCANVMDVSSPRSGVFVTELSESVMKSVLYSERRNGTRVDGLAFQKGEDGELLFGDITNPKSALVVEIAWGGKGYVARPVTDSKGAVVRTEIPLPLLQHRLHMEEPGTFLMRPADGQEVVDRLAGMLRGYKSDEGYDELDALKEAMQFAYGDKYVVEDDIDEQTPKADPFGDAAERTVGESIVENTAGIGESVERTARKEKYTPVNRKDDEKSKTKIRSREDTKNSEDVKIEVSATPGEDIDPSDIASIRAMLSGKSK